jgi:serine/threonine protein phosphatase PrpC
VKHWVKSVLISVIDGLGHGQFAHYAAEKARQYVKTHYDQPLDDIFRGAGRNCLATRGVVMALARFDWAEDKMTFASIGNIETRVIGGEKPFDLLVRRGIVGLNAPRAAVTEHGWDMSYTMVMHSDGLHSHWEAADLNGIAQEPATVVSARMLSKLARDNDDATVIVVKKDRQ